MMRRCECGSWTSNAGDCRVCEAGKAARARLAARETEVVPFDELSPEWHDVYEAVTRGLDGSDGAPYDIPVVGVL